MASFADTVIDIEPPVPVEWSDTSSVVQTSWAITVATVESSGGGGGGDSALKVWDGTQLVNADLV